MTRHHALMVPGNRRVYLDWNATAPLSVAAREAMVEAMDVVGNPSSVHRFGRRARTTVEEARHNVARLFGFDARDVVLTGGGTEANNLALRSLLIDPKAELVTSRLEHPSVVKPAEALAALGVRVRWLSPGPDGLIEPSVLEEALGGPSEGPRLVSIQAVNHETGAVQPIARLAEVAHAHGVYLHCDAVQAVGKIPLADVGEADLISMGPHKFGGPKGIGALATRCGIALRAIAYGGAQERGLRPGTQDPITAAGMSAAIRAVLERPLMPPDVEVRRDELERGLVALGADVAIINRPGVRAPHVVNASFQGWRGPELVAALDLEGVAASSGSACSAGTADPSPVIELLWGRARAESAVRFSLGPTTSVEDIQFTLASLATILGRKT